jgi:hypothetical protein
VTAADSLARRVADSVQRAGTQPDTAAIARERRAAARATAAREAAREAARRRGSVSQEVIDSLNAPPSTWNRPRPDTQATTRPPAPVAEVPQIRTTLPPITNLAAPRRDSTPRRDSASTVRDTVIRRDSIRPDTTAIRL